MLAAKEVSLLYETLLGNKLFDQPVKIGLSISRRNILALSKLIELGLREENWGRDSLLEATVGDAGVLLGIAAEMREKADLTELYEKMGALVK